MWRLFQTHVSDQTKGVFLVHNESSTGLPMTSKTRLGPERFRCFSHRRQCQWGYKMNIEMDNWHLDVVITALCKKDSWRLQG